MREMYSTPSCLSTPPRLRPLSIPIAPIKERARASIRRQLDFTPSKAPRSIPTVTVDESIPSIDICDLLPSLSNIILNQPINKSKASEWYELDSPFAFESDNTINSDVGSLNSLSDSSSASSLSPQFEKCPYMDPWNTSPKVNDITSELGRIYRSSFLSSIEGLVFDTPGPRVRYKPCHRVKKPGKSILRLHSGSLNLLVSSSRGSLEDATIFATEINASSMGSRGDKIPFIKNAFEKVTIPVNTSVKERHKENRKKLLGEDYESETELEEIDGGSMPDAAFIKGFEIKPDAVKGIDSTKRDVEVKSVQWARSLIL